MKLLIPIFCGTGLPEAFAEESEKRRPQLFTSFWKNVGDSFSGSNLYYHGAAVGSTGALIYSGVDAAVHETFRHTPNDAAWPGAVLASGAGAAVSGVWLYFSGKSSGDIETEASAYIIAQASLITGVWVKFLKTVTGRAHPSNTSHKSSREQSEARETNGFKIANGYGWPSGHMSHTVAISSALAHFYPEKEWLKWLGYGLSAYMLYTVSSFKSGQMHWFSDGVAGAFMGYAIGSTVGRNFRAEIDGTTEKQSSNFQWIPLVSEKYLGLFAEYRF